MQIYLPHRRKAFQPAGGGYDFEETWSGGTPDPPNSWTVNSGTPDYTSDRFNDPGSASMEVQIDPGVTGAFYIYFQFNISTVAGFEDHMVLANATHNEFELDTTISGSLWGMRVRGNGGVVANGANNKSLSTTYHCWIDRPVSAASFDLYISTTASSRGTAYISDSVGVTTDDITILKLGNTATGTTAYWIDRLIVHSSAIGTDP